MQSKLYTNLYKICRPNGSNAQTGTILRRSTKPGPLVRQTFDALRRRGRRATLQIIPLDGGVGEQRTRGHLSQQGIHTSQTHQEIWQLFRSEQPFVTSFLLIKSGPYLSSSLHVHLIFLNKRYSTHMHTDNDYGRTQQQLAKGHLCDRKCV